MTTKGKTPKFESVYNNPLKIRNVSLVGDGRHGKTSLFHFFDNFCHFTGEVESETTITRNTNYISRFTPQTEDFEESLISLFDSPGNYDYTAEVHEGSLRLTDSALVVVDCIEGVTYQTETLIKAVLEEGMKFVLIINKIDLLFLHDNVTTEEIYHRFNQIIDQVNSITVKEPSAQNKQDTIVSALKGSVAFTSAKMGWGFTLPRFSQYYGKKTSKSQDQILENLWGDQFIDGKNKIKQGQKQENWTRGCCKYILEPIRKVFESCLKGDAASIIQRIGINVNTDTMQSSKDIISTILQAWLPLSVTLMELMINRLPSPKEAQKYRIPCIFPENSLSSSLIAGIENCDEQGPPLMNTCKWIYAEDPQDSTIQLPLLVGRVLSGTISTGDDLVMIPSDKLRLQATVKIADIYLKTPQLMKIDRAVAGSIIALTSLPQVAGALATCTLEKTQLPMKCVLKEPPYHIPVEVLESSGKLKLHDSLWRLSAEYNSIKLQELENEQKFFISVNSPQQAEFILEELGKICNKKEFEPQIANLEVNYCETITAESPINQTRSFNKQHFMEGKSIPLPKLAFEAILEGKIDVSKPLKEINADLLKLCGWDSTDNEVWAISSQKMGSNVFVSKKKCIIDYEHHKSGITNGFMWFTGEGALLGEPVLGFSIHLEDVKVRPVFKYYDLMPSGVHAMARIFSQTCQLSSSPRLLEPVHLFELIAVPSIVDQAVEWLSEHNWQQIEMSTGFAGLYTVLKGCLSLRKYLEFSDAFENEIAIGHLRITCSQFRKWELLDSDPLIAGTEANLIVVQRRKSKGLGELKAT